MTEKPFSSIEVIVSVEPQDYLNGDAWWTAIKQYGLLDGCCSILGFAQTAGGEGGHAVAVHQKGEDYIFFDPNHGSFKYSKDNQLRALKHLFWEPQFPAPEGVPHGKKAVYVRRGMKAPYRNMNNVGYTIFQRKKPD